MVNKFERLWNRDIVSSNYVTYQNLLGMSDEIYKESSQDIRPWVEIRKKTHNTKHGC